MLKEIIHASQNRLGKTLAFKTGTALKNLTRGFRGKQGSALAAVSPETLNDLYQLITLFNELNVGYLLQGANTSLKGQSTPHGFHVPLIIIQTHKLKKFKIFDLPNHEEYKVIIVEPGLSLQELEISLNQLDYDLPHKIGSHSFGNTFGGSAANGCGGVRVDNPSGAPILNQLGNIGSISISSNGTIYNGIIKPERIASGQELLNLFDHDTLSPDDIVYPDLHALQNFMQSLFIAKKYPITNQLNENPFCGQGYEGMQAIAAMMYVIRKKPSKIQTYIAHVQDSKTKELFYQEVIFAKGQAYPDALPLLCESMNAELVNEITQNGITFLAIAFLTLATAKLHQHYVKLLNLRNRLMRFSPSLYLRFELSLGKLLSRLLIPNKLKINNFKELLVLQVANRKNAPNNIEEFNQRLTQFAKNHNENFTYSTLSPDGQEERLILQIRNAAALATLTLALRDQGTLFAFDDALMPGTMTDEYCHLLKQRLTQKFPDIHLQVYLYAHDLKQINHNDWVISFKNRRSLSAKEIHEIYQLQHQTVLDVNGIPHAEHGLGDHAANDLDQKNLIKLIAHRLLNDPKGLANPDNGFAKAYIQALTQKDLLNAGIEFAQNALIQELKHRTLLTYTELASEQSLQNKLKQNIQNLD